MSEFWKQWENQVVNGLYPLRRFLGASTHSAVFLTEHGAANMAAAIKFIRADAPLADLQLARWQAAAALSHPHLIRLLDWGQCRLGSHELLFVVMEYAEQRLAQILVHRALTFDEVREMMSPTLAALAFIHGSDWVHGQIKPSNVCVVDDALKLASDVLRPAGESSVGTVEFSPYDAPEETAGSSSSAGDLWGLGMTVVAALTRYPVARRHERSAIILPASVAPAFAAAIRQCLSLDPARRPTATDLEAQLNSADLSPTVPVPQPPAEPRPPMEPRPPVEAPAPRVDARRSRHTISGPYILGGIVVLAAAVWSGVHFMQPEVRPAPQAPASPLSGAASAVVASAAGPEQAPSRVVARPASPPAAVAGAPTGPVLHEEIPRVPRGALGTIHGRVKVVVRVAVNDAGNVTDTTLQYPGSSRYFAQMASESAKAWRFAPATARQSRKWLLQFEFTRTGVEANAVAMP
jgi:eukaryotic-like serine/threonine-protein kinase